MGSYLNIIYFDLAYIKVNAQTKLNLQRIDHLPIHKIYSPKRRKSTIHTLKQQNRNRFDISQFR